MKTKSLFLALCLIITCACSEEQIVNNNTKDTLLNKNLTDNLLIEKTSRSVNQVDAKKMAILFQKEQTNNPSRSTIDWNMEDVSVETLSDNNNIPLLHIVNMGNNNGYVIISATKNAHPIIAFSEKGSFNSELEIGSETYINQYKEEIQDAYLEDNPEDYATEWALFEKGNDEITSRATPTEIEVMIQAEINKKTALGYTYIGKLSALPYYLTQNEYEAVIRDISSHTNPSYDYEEVSLFFIKSYDFQKVDKLTNTEWHQYSPFNVDATNGYAGCYPIAVAQIVYYHKYPNTYNWNLIGNVPILNDEFKKFILDIRNKYCKVKYDETTKAEYEDAYNAFRDLGYIVTKEETPGAEHLRNETTAHRPVLMRGKNNDTGKGHAWVCEGYLNKKYQAVISMIDAGGDGNPYFDYPLNVNPVNDEMYGEFFYMNFGWLNGNNNGWYRSNAYNPHNPDKSYVNEQKILLVRKP